MDTKRTTQCPLCGDVPANLSAHLLRHVQEQIFRRPVHKKELNVDGNLNYHEKIDGHGQGQDNLAQPTKQQANSREKPSSRSHPCPESRCSYTAKTKSQLANHLLFHRSQKTFTCELCSKTFDTSGERQIHRSSHTDQKGYKCPVCLEAFPTLVLVIDHLSSEHLCEKHHICGKCGDEFGCAESLQLHKKTCPNNLDNDH